MLVRAGEDLLEDLLGVLLAQPEGLAADGIDVAREPGDELPPGVLVTAAASRDKLGIGEGCKLHGIHMKQKFAAGGKIPAARASCGRREEAHMQHPDVHLDYSRTRHSDLLRRARAGELADRMAASRREERRFFLARRRGQGSMPAVNAGSIGVVALRERVEPR